MEDKHIISEKEAAVLKGTDGCCNEIMVLMQVSLLASYP